MKKQNLIISAIVSIVIVIIAIIAMFFYSFLKTQELKTQVKLEEEKTKREVLKKEEEKVANPTNTTNTSQQTQTNNIEQQEEKMPKSEKEERLIIRKPVDVRKGSYCTGPSSRKSYFNTATVYDPNADHPYMADIHFSNCIIYGTHSEGEYKGRHTGPITITVSLAEEKNFRAVLKRNKWYLENGEIMRINGQDYKNVYFNGWLMYKQTQ